jgi:hypothetical protein
MDYTQFHNVLLLGEADFSFAAAFAQTFHGRITATEYSRDSLDRYDGCANHLKLLESKNVRMLQGVDATRLSECDIACDEWNGTHWEPSTLLPFSIKNNTQQPTRFDLIIFNFPHTNKYGKVSNLLSSFFKQVQTCIETNQLFEPTIVMELRLRHGPTRNVRADYNHEQTAQKNNFDLIQVRESDLDYWHALGYEHRMTKRNASCRGMPCQVWRYQARSTQSAS